jgi:Uma2 family endonuclease
MEIPAGVMSCEVEGSRMNKIAAAYEPVTRMSRAEYRAWAEQQPAGRYERINGIVVARDGVSAMAPERAHHNRRKFRAAQAFDAAIRAAGLPCEVFTDGMTVEVGDSDYEPDAIVRCGEKLAGDMIAVSDPLIIVEVLSPSTSSTDRAWKLQEYFKLPSLRHYLIIWADKQQVAHHQRGETGEIETRTVVGGEIRLDPPGLLITVEDIYAG